MVGSGRVRKSKTCMRVEKNKNRKVEKVKCKRRDFKRRGKGFRERTRRGKVIKK